MHFLSIHIHYIGKQFSTNSMKIRIPQILWKIYFPSILLHINVSFHKLYGNLNSTEFVENVLLMENIFPQIQWKTEFHCNVHELNNSTKKFPWIDEFTLSLYLIRSMSAVEVDDPFLGWCLKFPTLRRLQLLPLSWIAAVLVGVAKSRLGGLLLEFPLRTCKWPLS